jgi:hypothetical protein
VEALKPHVVVTGIKGRGGGWGALVREHKAIYFGFSRVFG